MGSAIGLAPLEIVNDAAELADERRYGVFQRRAPYGEIGRLRLDVLELRHGPLDVDRRGDLGGEPAARQIERRLIIGDGVGEQLGVGVEAAQANIGARELRVQLEARLRERVGAGLRVGFRRLDEIAHTPPEIDFVGGDLGVDLVGAVKVRLSLRAQRAIVGLPIVCEQPGEIHLRIEAGLGDRREGVRQIVRRDGGGEVRVGRIDAILQIVERPVVEASPPQTRRVENAVARLGRFLEMRRQRDRRRLVVRRKIAAANQQRRGRRQQRPHLHSACPCAVCTTD